MGSPLDDVEYLARSANRVRILETLAEGPHDRTDLQGRTGAARATIGRILGEFEQRGWVKRSGPVYETTPLGDFLTKQFRALLDGVVTMRKLRDVVEWLPTEEFDFGLERFADAEITRPRPGVPAAPVRRAADLIRDSDRVRVLARVPMTLAVEAYPEAVSAGTRLEIVFSADAVAIIAADRRMKKRFEEALLSERVRAYRYDGSIPYILGVATAGDRTRTGIGAVDDDGIPRGYVISEDEAIRAWAEATIDAYRREAVPIDADAFGS